ncbi:MAG: hypothetical protein QXM22_01000, partial [Candidatus Bathyarchaeia archaeon]
MPTKIPHVDIFLIVIVVMLMCTLGMESFSGMDLGNTTDYGVTSSFTVYTDGKNYYAADSITGKIYYQSRNCTRVVAEVISITPESASIAFKAGVYPCNITVNKKLSISGEGRATIIIQGTITFNAEMINDTPASHHAFLQNLRMEGQNRLKIGVKYESSVPSVPLITIQNVDIENYTEYGIYFANASDCVFDNVVIGNCATAIHYTTNHN